MTPKSRGNPHRRRVRRLLQIPETSWSSPLNAEPFTRPDQLGRALVQQRAPAGNRRGFRTFRPGFAGVCAPGRAARCSPWARTENPAGAPRRSSRARSGSLERRAGRERGSCSTARRSREPPFNSRPHSALHVGILKAGAENGCPPRPPPRRRCPHRSHASCRFLHVVLT